MSIKCNLRDVAKVLLEDEKEEIKKSGKWPLLVDPSDRACTFLKYRNVNYLCALQPDDMQAERLRLAVLGSIRFGKPLVVDMMDGDMFTTLSENMKRVNAKLMDWIISKEILKEEKYKTLIKDDDDSSYDVTEFSPDFIKNFVFILATKMENPPQNLMEKFCPVVIE